MGHVRERSLVERYRTDEVNGEGQMTYERSKLIGNERERSAFERGELCLGLEETEVWV